MIYLAKGEKYMKVKKYEKVYESIRNDILDGFLKKGDKLMSIHQAVFHFQVSKTSIEKAYYKLEEEGYIHAFPKKGYYVLVDSDSLTLRKQLLYPVEEKQQTYRYNISRQAIDKAMFDFTIWKRYLKNVMELQEELVTYGDVAGEWCLRQALSQYAYRMRKVLTYPERIVVGASVQILLYQVLALLKTKKVVAMHSDGYLQAKRTFMDLGYTIVYYDTLSVQWLTSHHVEMLYIQHPMLTLDEKQREEVLEWSLKYQAYIIEDDHNGELMNFYHLQPAFQKMDVNHIIYIGSFSRLLPSSFRISYVVMPQTLQKDFEKQKGYYSPSASKIEQIALANYIIDGHFDRYVKKLIKNYKEKSDVLIKLLQEVFKHAQVFVEPVHLRCYVRFEKHTNMRLFARFVEEEGICMDVQDDKFIISFAGIAMEDMKDVVMLLKKAYQRYCELQNLTY